MTSLNNIADYLLDNQKSIAHNIVDSVLTSMNINIPEWEKKQAEEMYIEFVSCLGDYINNEEDKVPQSLVSWSKKNAAMVSLEGKISTIAVRYPPTRDVITDLLTDLGIESGLNLRELSKLVKQANRLLDISLNETILAFEQLAEQYQKKAKMELAEVSTPIVPVKEGIVILPLVGTIDAERARYLMENVLPKIAHLDVKHVIADFSGVPSLERENGIHLQQIGQMLRLMGIHIISTGISPKLAQIAVNAGIDLSRSETYANLKRALESLEMVE
jgi:rsbT co-antagonist protein RsbR